MRNAADLKGTSESKYKWTCLSAAHYGARYLDGLHYTIDGNFQQTQKNKPMDEEDEPLTLGGAYYADERDFKEFQRTRPRDKKDATGRLGACRPAREIRTASLTAATTWSWPTTRWRSVSSI